MPNKAKLADHLLTTALPYNWRADSPLYEGVSAGPFHIWRDREEDCFAIHTVKGPVAYADTEAEAVEEMRRLAERHHVRTEMDDICYFIGSKNGPIKIGYTRDLNKRLRTMQTSYPFKLEVLATTTGGQIAEARYHQRFADYRLEGEWFTPCQAIRSEIRRLNKLANAPALTTTQRSA